MASKFGKFFSVATMATIAGCNALGGLEKLVAGTAMSTPVPTPESGVAQEGPDTIAAASPTPAPLGTYDPSTPKPATPAPTPFPCEALDGTKPTLRGEIVTLPNGGKGVQLYTACHGIGREMANGGPRDIRFNSEVPTDAAAMGMVDDQLYVLVKGVVLDTYFDWTKIKISNQAIFRRAEIKGQALSFALVKNEHYDGDNKYAPVNKIVTWHDWRRDTHPNYDSWIGALPGSPQSTAGDVASVSYDTEKNWGYDNVFLTPTAEARWGADGVDFGCAPFEGQYERYDTVGRKHDLSYRVIRKVSVGRRYIPFLRAALSRTGPEKCVDSYGSLICDQPHAYTYDHGAWVLTKDGKWTKTKIFGPPIQYYTEEPGNNDLAMPVWDEGLNGFVTSRPRATKVYPEGYDEKGEWRPATTYEVEKLGASFRLVTEDELAASLEPTTGGCRAAN